MHDPLSVEGLVGQLQTLRDAEIYVAVVGAVSGALRLACQLAGVVAVVTDPSQCDRLAAAVQKAAEQQRNVLVDWKIRYLNRIPWPAFD